MVSSKKLCLHRELNTKSSSLKIFSHISVVPGVIIMGSDFPEDSGSFNNFFNTGARALKSM